MNHCVFAPSYSIILVEIATRSDLITVSMERHRNKSVRTVCKGARDKSASLLKQEQAEPMKLDVMWRPPLPELKAGKADTHCPNQAEYCEVCS